MKTGICVSVMLLMAWVISVASETADRHFDKARELLNAGKYKKAAEEFTAIAKLSPNGSELEQNARYWIGQCYFRMGEFDEALSTFEKLVQDYPESSIIPVTQLMMARVEQEKRNEKLKAKSNNSSDEDIIIDPKTGLRYTKIRVLTGDNDVIKDIEWRKTSFSPDGRFLLWDKIVIPLDGGRPFDLVDMPASRGIWSPDGKKVAFYSGGATWVVPVSPETGQATGIARKLLDGEHGVRPDWSPDSEKLAIVRTDEKAQSDIWTLSVKDGALVQLTNDPVQEYYQAWSPDGDPVFWIIPLGGGDPVPLKLDVSIPGKPVPGSLSPDCSKFLFSMKQSDGTEDLWVAPISLNDGRTTGPAVMVFKGWDAGYRWILMYPWSPDGSKIAVYKEGIWIVSAEGGIPVQITKAQTRPHRVRQMWSPDGKMISYLSDSSGKTGLYVIPASGGEATKILGDIHRLCYAWSPDSKEIAAVSEEGRQLLAISVRGKIRPIIDLNELPLDAWDIRWSPDRQSIIFVGWKAEDEPNQIFIVPAEGGKAIELAVGHRSDLFCEIYLSPDGKWISYNSEGYIKTRPESSIWEVDVSEFLSGGEKK